MVSMQAKTLQNKQHTHAEKAQSSTRHLRVEEGRPVLLVLRSEDPSRTAVLRRPKTRRGTKEALNSPRSVVLDFCCLLETSLIGLKRVGRSGGTVLGRFLSRVRTSEAAPHADSLLLQVIAVCLAPSGLAEATVARLRSLGLAFALCCLAKGSLLGREEGWRSGGPLESLSLVAYGPKACQRCDF